MYSDEGITGTSTKRREGFNNMIQDALDGKIDLIITKSVSRFARNTVDSLSTIRKLKENGIEVYFEKENIWTFDAKGELLITIMSSLAQEESRSISENTTWGVRKSKADGNVYLADWHFLGYDRGPKGEWVINKKQAETVREIYRLYLSGYSFAGIAKELEAQKKKSPEGHQKWSPSSVKSILVNEKYKGDALLQKTYTADFLTKKAVKNNGEVPQYYIEDHHEAIITKEIFEAVQHEMERRTKLRTRYNGKTIFSGKIMCGECGGVYGRKTWHSDRLNCKQVWQCNEKYRIKGQVQCHTPHLSEQEIQSYFIRSINNLYRDRKAYIEDMKILLETMESSKSLKVKLDAARLEVARLAEKTTQVMTESSRLDGDAEFKKKYDKLFGDYTAKKTETEGLEERWKMAKVNEGSLKLLIKTLKEMSYISTAFDDRLWCSLVETMEVFAGGDVIFHFRGGFDMTVSRDELTIQNK